MKLTTGILAVALMAGGAFAQNPDAIDNARSMARSLQQKQANDTNAALTAAGVPSQPAPAVRRGNSPFRPAAIASGAAPKPGAKAWHQQAAKQGTPAVLAAPVKASAAPVLAADGTKQPKPEDKKWSLSGKRDPFFSPVVQQSGGSGCATGKKCLEIGQINLRGVVKSDAGFIAVVTNNLNKAYFLRENDPVFNGYVVKITGDSVVFQETVQDKLGKASTREVVKKIFTPAV